MWDMTTMDALGLADILNVGFMHNPVTSGSDLATIQIPIWVNADRLCHRLDGTFDICYRPVSAI